MDVHDYIKDNEAKLVGQLQEMVRLATVNPPGEQYGEMVDLLERRCRQLAMEVQVHQVPAAQVAAVADKAFPRYNLIARWDVGAAKTVHFNAHYDVVPAEGAWLFGDAFEPGLKKGWLYGRGSGDMKGSIAALLMGIEALQAAGVQPKFNVECSFTADEETGGALGAGYVVKQKLLDADFVVVCEGAAGTRVGLGHNGVLWFDVVVEGVAAHASSPDQGVNAFEHAASLVHHLQDWKKALSGTRRRWLDLNGKARYPTVNIGGVFGSGAGAKVNTVPARAHFTIDRRVVPNESLQTAEAEVLGALEKAAAKVQGIKYSAKTAMAIAPCLVEADQPLAQAFAGAIRAVRRRPVDFRLTAGFTDLHFFVQEGGRTSGGWPRSRR